LKIQNNLQWTIQLDGWCLSSDLYKEYHDQEWGTPVYDDATLFEFLILETFQAGSAGLRSLTKEFGKAQLLKKIALIQKTRSKPFYWTRNHS
jgi:hypothetical protein